MSAENINGLEGLRAAATLMGKKSAQTYLERTTREQRVARCTKMSKARWDRVRAAQAGVKAGVQESKDESRT